MTKSEIYICCEKIRMSIDLYEKRIKHLGRLRHHRLITRDYESEKVILYRKVIKRLLERHEKCLKKLESIPLKHKPEMGDGC